MKIFKYIALVMIGCIILFFGIGLFTPTVTYTNTISINASPAKCFRLFMDTARMNEWMPGFKSFKIEKGKGLEEGSKWNLVLIQEGQSFDMSETVKTVKPDEQFSFLLENAVLHNTVDMYFKPSGSNTELVVNNIVSGNNIMWKSLFYFNKSRLQDQSMEMYDDLKTMIETSPE